MIRYSISIEIEFLSVMLWWARFIIQVPGTFHASVLLVDNCIIIL